jgi:predicted metal-dependent peptidase
MKQQITNKCIDEYINQYINHINHHGCNCHYNNLHEYIVLFALTILSVFVLKIFFNEVQSDMEFQPVFVDDDEDDNFSSDEEQDQEEQDQGEQEQEQEQKKEEDQEVVNA